MITKILTIGKAAASHRFEKQNYRFIDFKRSSFSEKKLEIVAENIPDPNRTANISIIFLGEGYFTNVLGTIYAENQKHIENNQLPKFMKETGNSLRILEVPIGTIIHALELLPNMGAKLIRAAGTSAILLKKILKYCLVKLRSGEHRLIPNQCFVCFGHVGNPQHFLRKLKKAGDSRLRSLRPKVRPSAMNPVDHPMGGRTKGGCAPQSATGKLAHGPSTVKKKHHKMISITSRKLRWA